MLDIERSRQFEKDFKLAKKRGKKFEKLWNILELLSNGEPLPPRCRPHKLTGNMNGYWECHIEPDFLLIYDYTPGKLHLLRLGAHADLFK